MSDGDFVGPLNPISSTLTVFKIISLEDYFWPPMKFTIKEILDWNKWFLLLHAAAFL